MKRFRRLCEATRQISPAARIIIHGIPDRDDLWVIRVQVGDVILFETSAAPLDKVVVEASKSFKACPNACSWRPLRVVTRIQKGNRPFLRHQRSPKKP